MKNTPAPKPRGLDLMKTPMLAKVVTYLLLQNAGVPDEQCAIGLAQDNSPYSPIILTDEDMTFQKQVKE